MTDSATGYRATGRRFTGRGSGPASTALGPTARLLVLASVTVSFLAGSAAPTPLYATYQADWGFSALTTTVVFGIYAIALLATLLTAGRLSDHLGRRPALLAGIAGQMAAMLVFASAHSVAALIAARVIQGLATGAAIGAVGAAMLDIDARRGAAANATAPGIGTGGGALASAVAVQWLPAPTHLVYLALTGVLAVQAVAVILLPETSPRAPGAWRSLIPQVALPAPTRAPLMAAAPVLFAVWALAGFYGSLGPSLVSELTGSRSVIGAGLGLGILAGMGAITTYVLRAAPAARAMLAGTLALAAGVAATLLAVLTKSPAGFFAATALAGVGFGAGFAGGIRLVAPLAPPEQRSGVLSVLYIVSYLGLGVPAVAAGLAVVHWGDLTATTYQYGLVIIALALIAAANLARLRARRPAARHAVTSPASPRVRLLDVTSTVMEPAECHIHERCCPAGADGAAR